jgi:hypothetical protein
VTGYAPQEVRHNRHVLRFEGRVLGEGSSRRRRAPRWSEVTIYGLRNGGYVLAKRGYSLVVHRPDCPTVNREMTAWIDLPDDDDRRAEWSGCATCQPDLDEWDPQTLVEGTRYTAVPVRSPQELEALLWERPPHLPPLQRIAWFIQQAIMQACINDRALAEYWAHRPSDR